MKGSVLLLLLALTAGGWAQTERGRALAWGDYAQFHYEAWFDGKLVDDTRKKGEPYAFQVGAGEVLEEVEKGVVGMRAGEVRELTVEVRGKKLIMRMELLDFHPPNQAHDGSEGRQGAWEQDKPAMFEYMIRDFFNQPWRFADGGHMLLGRSALIALVDFVLIALMLFLRHRRNR